VDGHSLREDAAQVTGRLLGSKTVNTFLELMQSVEGVELGELEPMTTVLVWTWNSLYRVVVAEGSDVLVQGGLMFPQPTPAHVDGASTRGGPLKIGWISLGIMMELHVSGQRIVTTPVIAIATERTGMFTVH
jgi:hypothetical protein